MWNGISTECTATLTSAGVSWPVFIKVDSYKNSNSRRRGIGKMEREVRWGGQLFSVAFFLFFLSSSTKIEQQHCVLQKPHLFWDIVQCGVLRRMMMVYSRLRVEMDNSQQFVHHLDLFSFQNLKPLWTHTYCSTTYTMMSIGTNEQTRRTAGTPSTVHPLRPKRKGGGKEKKEAKMERKNMIQQRKLPASVIGFKDGRVEAASSEIARRHK